MKILVAEDIRDIRHNELRDNDGTLTCDELDDVTADDTGPMSDTNDTAGQSEQSQSSPIPSQGNTTQSGDASNTVPPHTGSQSTPLTDSAPAQLQPSQPTGSQPTSAPSPANSQTGAVRIPEKIFKCKNYKGHKWYWTKWVNHKFKSWVIERNLPEDMVRKFHIDRTQSGKVRKSKRGPK